MADNLSGSDRQADIYDLLGQRVSLTARAMAKIIGRIEPNKRLTLPTRTLQHLLLSAKLEIRQK